MLAAQKLMSVQLGLDDRNEIQSTLFPKMTGRGVRPVLKGPYVQVHHVPFGGGHWLLSRLDSDKKEVSIYDSLNSQRSSWSIDFIHQLHQLYGHLVKKDDKKLCVSLVVVQQQSNGSDCGGFAIANGFEIVTGGNPGVCFYNCELMQKHLMSVLVR